MRDVTLVNLDTEWERFEEAAQDGLPKTIQKEPEVVELLISMMHGAFYAGAVSASRQTMSWMLKEYQGTKTALELIAADGVTESD